MTKGASHSPDTCLRAWRLRYGPAGSAFGARAQVRQRL